MKIKIIAGFFIILFCLDVFAAAPAVTVISPNGGEVISGSSFPVTFKVSDADNEDINLSSMYQSVSAGSQNILITEDENLMLGSSCDWNFLQTWTSANDINAGLSQTYPDNNISGQGSVFDHGGKTHFIILDHNVVGGSDPPVLKGFTWNTTTKQWDTNTAFWRTNITSLLNISLDAPDNPSVVVFIRDDNVHMIVQQKTRLTGLKFLPDTKQWEFDNDTNLGITTTLPASDCQITMAYFERGTIPYLIIQEGDACLAETGVSEGFNWNGTNWVANSNVTAGLPSSAIDYVITVFEHDNETHLISVTGAAGGFVFDFDWNGAGWNDSNDFSTSSSSFTDIKTVFKTLGDDTVKAFRHSFTGTGGFDGAVNLTRDNTTEPTLCTYDWNIEAAPAGQWFIDINVIDSSGVVATDSSDAAFIINPSLIGNIIVTNITNVTNEIKPERVILTPTVEKSQIIFSVESTFNGALSIDFNIQNSLDNGKQYKIFTATETEYDDGIWNFNDTLTWGTSTTTNDAIQKIWDANNSRYEYSFIDVFIALEKKFFKLEYVKPIAHFNSIAASPVWDKALVPDATDFNGSLMDLYQISSFSNLTSTLTDPKFPDITSSYINENYIFQVTGKAESTETLNMGVLSDLIGGSSTTTGISLQPNFQTLTTNISSGFATLNTSASSPNELFLHNYVVMDRGFFSKSLDVFSSTGAELPAIIDSGLVFQYITEGKDFIVDTEYYDPDGKINFIEVSAYLGDVVQDENRIKRWLFDAADASENRIQFRETLNGIIDLTQNAPNRIMKLAVKLVDTNSDTYQIQTDNILLVQYPFFPDDMQINAFIQNKAVGKHPAGQIFLNIDSPNNLTGVNIYIYDINGDPRKSDFNKSFYKDVDFECRGFVCSFDFELVEWVFPKQGNFRFTASALLTTQPEDYNSSITAITKYFRVFWKDFETARIFETVERTNHDYRNDEEISLVMQLREAGSPVNLKNQLNVWITLYSCDAAAAGFCVHQDINYPADSFLYDAETGYNYYFWRDVFIDENGSLLADGNYYRIEGRVQDVTGSHENVINPVLAPKCNTYDNDCSDGLCFIANMLAGLNHFLWGCTVGTSAKVTLTDNSGEQIRLLINATKSLTAPSQECFWCLNNDSNNVYVNNLEQDILCGGWYKFNEAPIDQFDFYLSNKNTDFSKDPADIQYIKVSVPYSLVAFNDLTLMKQSLATEFGTEADTVGELIWQGVNNLVIDLANPLSDVAENYLFNADDNVMTGLINNAGFDCNFNVALDPTFIDGLIFFKTSGIKVINQEDYKESIPALEEVDPQDFVEYMHFINASIPSNETTVDVYVSNMKKVMSETVSSPLVIDVPYSTATIRQENVSGQEVDYQSLPSKLGFIAISDLIYNNERNVIRRFVPFVVTAIIEPEQTFNWIGGPIGGIIEFVTNPGRFIARNWVLIVLAIGALMAISGIYSRFKGTGVSIYTNKGE